MPQDFEDVIVTFHGEEQSTDHIPRLSLLDNGWVRAEFPIDGGGNVTEYFSPYEVRSFHEA